MSEENETKINVKLLRRVQKAIVEHAAHFDMSEWGVGASKADIMHDEPPESECGTTACIAGFAVILRDGKARPSEAVALRAAKLLSLDYDSWDFGCNGTRLFHVQHWPSKFYHRYSKAKRNLTRARIAAERIEHFIKTKGAE